MLVFRIDQGGSAFTMATSFLIHNSPSHPKPNFLQAFHGPAAISETAFLSCGRHTDSVNVVCSS